MVVSDTGALPIFPAHGMLSESVNRKQTIMRTIASLTAIYVAFIAAVMFYASEKNSKASGILFGEALFSLPMALSFILYVFLNNLKSRRILLIFSTSFAALSALIFLSTIVGEKEAQYQLNLLMIPILGFPAVMIAGAMAIFWKRKKR